MTIPTGVNQLEFYKKAIEKGIKITSKYKYVYAKVLNKGTISERVSWVGIVRVKGKNITFKHRPFTPIGEEMAYKEAIQYIEEYGSNLQKTKVKAIED